MGGNGTHLQIVFAKSSCLDMARALCTLSMLELAYTTTTVTTSSIICFFFSISAYLNYKGICFLVKTDNSPLSILCYWYLTKIVLWSVQAKRFHKIIAGRFGRITSGIPARREPSWLSRNVQNSFALHFNSN